MSATLPAGVSLRNIPIQDSCPRPSGLPAGAPLRNIRIRDSYWDRYIGLVPRVVIPYQWNILNDAVPDAPPSHCLQNFRIAAGEARGARKGTIFQDSDVAKWLEAVAYSLATQPDPELERTADEVVALIGRAQCADGYLNTYYTLVEPQRRWTNLAEGHELYCAGHMIEAAVAYYQATGKRNLLDIMCRFADLICSVFGPGEDQLHGYPGHPEIELALVQLYAVTGQERYARLARYFVDVRGGDPNYFLQEMARPDYKNVYPEFLPYDPAYSQSHLPVRRQQTAEGHAVRAVYLYCAMADLAGLYGDQELLASCEALWDNMVNRRMYITGGIGSSGLLERFTTDYDLPGDSAYAETCASIGLARFGLRMARLTGDASYLDVVERALYNTVRAGISLSGDRYFYVNPLEVWPRNCMEHTSRAHVKPVRQKWFDVACCPTNVARTLTGLGEYLYSVGERELYVNLFVQNEARVEIGGQQVGIMLETDYPKTGCLQIQVEAQDAAFALMVRVPSFARDFTVMVNGERMDGELCKGFCRLDRTWGKDIVTVQFAIVPALVYANPLVRYNTGKAAIVRGPEVYCLEEADNGGDLACLAIPSDTAFEESWDEDLFGGTVVLKAQGYRLEAGESSVMDAPPRMQPVTLTAIPYGSWGNRAPGQMVAWIQVAP